MKVFLELIMVFPADWNDFMLVLQVALGYFLHIHVLVIIILATHYVPEADNLFKKIPGLNPTQTGPGRVGSAILWFCFFRVGYTKTVYISGYI